MRDELARMKAELEKLGGKVPPDIWATLQEAHDNVEGLERQMSSTVRRLGRLKQSAMRDKAAYQAMTVEMPKWRTTILLGLNSAAIIAVLGLTNVDPHYIQISVLIFLVGALCALASGGVLENLGRFGLHFSDEIESVDLDDDETRDEDLDRAEGSSKKVYIYYTLSEVLRGCSLIAFAVGVILISLNIHAAPAAVG